MNLRYRGSVKHAIRILKGDDSLIIGDKEVLEFAENWERITGGDIDVFIERNQARIRWTKTYNNRNFFIGTVPFDREMAAMGYALTLFIPLTRFREMLSDASIFHDFRDKIYDFENRIIESEKALILLKEPVGWFRSIFSDNSWDIEQQEILLKENKEYLASYTEQNKEADLMFVKVMEEFKTPIAEQKDWKNSFFD